MNKPILCVDFDGVIHRYSRGWQDGTIYDPPVEGFFEWLLKAQRDFTIIIYSSRSSDQAKLFEMMKWFGQAFTDFCHASGLEETTEVQFAATKPPAFLTIDDRALQFKGDWSAAYLDPKELLKFRPWTSSPAPEAPAADPNDPTRH